MLVEVRAWSASENENPVVEARPDLTCLPNMDCIEEEAERRCSDPVPDLIRHAGCDARGGMLRSEAELEPCM
jgi:hypothetical protein